MRRMCFICFFVANITQDASAAVTYFDFEDVSLRNTLYDTLFIDFDAVRPEQVMQRLPQTGSDLLIGNVGNPDYLMAPMGTPNWVGLGHNTTVPHRAFFFTKLSGGDVIVDQLNETHYFTDFTYSSHLMTFKQNGYASPWDDEDGTTKRYLAFRSPEADQMAWLGLYYNAGTFEITFTDMARANGMDEFRTFAAGDTVSAVPEPGESLFMTAMLLLGAVYAKHRKDQHSSQPHQSFDSGL